MCKEDYFHWVGLNIYLLFGQQIVACISYNFTSRYINTIVAHVRFWFNGNVWHVGIICENTSHH